MIEQSYTYIVLGDIKTKDILELWAKNNAVEYTQIRKMTDTSVTPHVTYLMCEFIMDEAQALCLKLTLGELLLFK